MVSNKVECGFWDLFYHRIERINLDTVCMSGCFEDTVWKRKNAGLNI